MPVTTRAFSASAKIISPAWAVTRSSTRRTGPARNCCAAGAGFPLSGTFAGQRPGRYGYSDVLPPPAGAASQLPALAFAGADWDAQELDSLFQSDDGIRAWTPRLSSLNSLLLDLQSLLNRSPQPDPDPLGRLLANWGAPLQMVGVGYLKESVSLALQYDSHFAIRKDILQEVGDRHTLTDFAVDSGIRRLIDALDNQNAPAWQDFRRRHNLPAKLTTGKFIYAIRDELTKPLPVLNAIPEGEPLPHERETQPAAVL